MSIKNKCIIIFFVFSLIIFISCSIENSEPNEDNSHNEHETDEEGNPDGYDVYLLTGNSLNSRNIDVNDLVIDTSSLISINTSIQDIINSSYRYNVVKEVTSDTADFVIDYTGTALNVPDTYYGFNMQIASKQFLTLPKYKELVKNIKVDIIRFPGGQERVRFDKDASADAEWNFGNDSEYQFLLTGHDVENYINLCNELNIKAEPEVNIHNNNPEMAENFISYIVDDLSYDLKYISAGNEPEANAFSNLTYLDADNAEEAMDNYMTRYKTYYDRIKSVKSDVEFALCETGSWQSNHLETYLDRMLGQIDGKTPGAVSVHWYMLGDWGQPSYYPGFPSLEHMVINSDYENRITYLSDVINTMKQERDQYAPGAKLFIGEWGVTWSATAESTKIMDRLSTVIFNAEVMEYCKTLGFNSMQFFSISDPKDFDPWNPALIAVDGDNFTLRPQYYLYLFYKYLWGDEIVTIADNQKDNYSIYASKDESYHYIMLINRTAGKKYKKSVKVITETGSKNLKLNLKAKSVTIIRF